MTDSPATAADLLEALLAQGIADGVRTLPGAERTVRPERLWKERVGNTALRLLVLGDDPEPAPLAKGGVLVFGPRRKAPLRSLPAAGLLRLLRDADTQDSGLLAMRWLTSALARDDRAERPGLLVRGLLTTHTVTERFRRSPKWKDAEETVRCLRGVRAWNDTLRGLGFSLVPLPKQGWLLQDGNARVAVSAGSSARSAVAWWPGRSQKRRRRSRSSS